jgi:dTDP-4-dehydrorhamnose reductase
MVGHGFLKTAVRLAQEREELRVLADQRGSLTSTRDLADAILRIGLSVMGIDWDELKALAKNV